MASSGKTIFVLACLLSQRTCALQQSPHAPPSVFGYYNLDKPPPRVGTSAPIDLAKAAVTVKHLQDFVAASSEGYASIVFMGDSTMAGITTDLMTVTDETLHYRKLLYTSNDSPQKVKFTDDGSSVKPGGEWSVKDESDPRSKLIVERSRAATKILHSKNCSWSGPVETFFFDGGPLDGFAIHSWGFIPEWGETCWHDCFGDAVKAFKSSAVIWNVGFHLLNHGFDEPTCSRRQNMAKENCGDYKELVRLGTQQLLDVAPLVVWRTTNYLCEKRQRAFLSDGAMKEYDKWQDPAKRASMEKACHKSCDLMDDFTCFDWLFSPGTTERLHREGLSAISDLKSSMKSNQASRIRVLDTFGPTKECCDRGCETETEDGEHYRGLDRSFIDTFAATLMQGA